MDWEIFKLSIDLFLKEPVPEGVVGLHHFGESLLHPQIGSYLQYLEDRKISWRLSTNGRMLSRPDIRRMLLDTNYGLLVVSMENGVTIPDVNKLICEKAKFRSKLQILLQTFGKTNLSRVQKDGCEIRVVKMHSWAKYGHGDMTKCCFLVDDWVCILWDGTIVSCCMDMEGESVLGHVKEGRCRNRPWRACKTCEVVAECF